MQSKGTRGTESIVEWHICICGDVPLRGSRRSGWTKHDTHTWLLKSFMMSRKWLYISGLSRNCTFTASKYPKASGTFSDRASTDGPTGPGAPSSLAPFIGVVGLGVFFGVLLRDGDEGRLRRALWVSRNCSAGPDRGVGAGSLGRGTPTRERSRAIVERSLFVGAYSRTVIRKRSGLLRQLSRPCSDGSRTFQTSAVRR